MQNPAKGIIISVAECWPERFKVNALKGNCLEKKPKSILCCRREILDTYLLVNLGGAVTFFLGLAHDDIYHQSGPWYSFGPGLKASSH